MKLLTRKQFRDECFKRDGYKCVLCDKTAIYDSNGEVNNLDAHHLVDRALWKDGGYYLCNSATLCDPDCHMKAEQTLVSVEELREKCDIKKFILPEQFSEGEIIDKWGNPVLPNGSRMKGELFEGHEDILAPVLHLFIDKIKFPRIYHFTWSPGVTNDDRILNSVDQFKGKEIVVTEKMDGENTSFYKNGFHARSLTYENHPSRSMVRSIHANIAHDIPEGMRICGENLYAKHSIHYENLSSWFLVFTVWNKQNICLSWDETKEWAELLGLQTVPELYRGIWNETKMKQIQVPNNSEGYVVRVVDEIPYNSFRTKVGKWVRANHVQSSSHWMHQQIVPNKLK